MTQAILDAAAIGSTVELGSITTATPLVVPDGVHLANSHIKATSPIARLLTAGNGSNVLNTGLDGNGLVASRMLDVKRGSSDVRIDGVDTFNEGTADVYYFDTVRNSKWTNCTSRDGWNAVTLRGYCERVTLRNNEILGYRARGIYGISDLGTRHITIDGLEIGRVIGHDGTSKQPIGFQSSGRTHRYLNIDRVTVEGIFQGGSSPRGRFGRHADGNTADAISIHRGQDGSIKNCTVSDTGEIGINLSWNTKNFDVSNNTIIRSHLTGISCGVNSNGASEVVNQIDVHSNQLIDNGQMFGDTRPRDNLSANLWFENAQDCSAMRNIIIQTRGNTRWGIRTNNVRRIDLENYFRGFDAADYHQHT
jgi:hypothetical protein